MPLGVEVGLRLGDFVFEGHPTTPKKKGTSTKGRSVGGAGGVAEHPRAAGAAPVLRMARSTPS